MNPQRSLIIKCFLIYGTITTFSYKFMGLQSVEEGGKIRMFFHPYMQTFTIFIGEFVCLLYYFKYKKEHEIVLEEGKSAHQKYCFIIPAVSDVISTFLQYMALNFISGSTYLILKGCSIVTTAFFSKVVFGMRVEKQQIAGCICSIFGLIIVGLSGFFESHGNQQNKTMQSFGTILMLVSLIFNGYVYAYQQHLMEKHSIHPLEMVGWEGAFGLIAITIVCLTLTFVPCGFKQNLCVFTSHTEAYMQRFDVFFHSISNSLNLMLLSLSGIISTALYNFYGITIIKIYDGLTKSLLNIVRTSIVWVVGLIITLIVGNHSIYKIESTNLKVILVKIIGYTLIIVGTLVSKKFIFKEYFQEELKPQNRALIFKGNNNLEMLSLPKQNRLLKKNTRTFL